MSTSLPLPKGFFDTNVRLSEEARQRYIEFAEDSIRKIFALSDGHKNGWIPVREKKGVAVYRNFGLTRGAQSHKSNVAEVGCRASVRGSLEEVGRAYAAHDDALFRRLMKKLNAGVMDTAVLFTIVPRTPLTPFRYIGIKWFAIKTPTPLVSHRDYCCLEVQDKIVDAYGNEMFIRILNSIEVPECPSLENSHGLVRAKLLAGHMYRTDRGEPDVVRVHHVARFDPAGYFPSQWAFKTTESQLIGGIVQLQRIVEKQQMNACTFVDKRQWVPNQARQSCAVCSRGFGTFRPRHHCRCCGEVICGKCSVFRSVDVPGTTLKNVRICSVCNMGVQKAAATSGGRSRVLSQEDGVDTDNMSDHSTSSFTSSSTVAHNEMNMMDLYLSANTPGTPSEYSSASTQSNLSIRSTASSRSVLDARARGQSLQPPSTPHSAMYRSRQGTGFSAQTPVGYRGNGQPPRSFASDAATPRSYIANNLTQNRSMNPNANVVSEEAFMQRMSMYKQAPLDLNYLRDSIVESSSASSSTQAIRYSMDAAAVESLEEKAARRASSASVALPMRASIATSRPSRTSSLRDSLRGSFDKKPLFRGIFSRGLVLSERSS